MDRRTAGGGHGRAARWVSRAIGTLMVVISLPATISEGIAGWARWLSWVDADAARWLVALGGVALVAIASFHRKPKFEDQLRQLITDKARTLEELHEATGYAMSLVEAMTGRMVAAGTAIAQPNPQGEMVFQAIDPHRGPAIQPPPVDPGPELPTRELTPEEEEFLFAPTARPDEPITAGLDRPRDPVLYQALGQARRVASAIRTLVDEVQLPPLDALRDSRKLAMWTLQKEQATLGRYMNKLHGHVLVAVDGLRPYVHHDELDRLYRNPRNTGDLRTIASLLDAVADFITPRP